MTKWAAGFGVLTAVCVMSAHACAQDRREPETTTVTVKGKKKPVKKELGKTIYDAASNPKAANGTAQDVLQSTPGVSVTAEGQIAVKGNANVTVLINGKPSAVMSGADRAVALQTMNGSDIASVEVITNPSAAYDANGGAIVNIVLRKNRKPGAHGQVRGAVSDQGLWNVAASGDATKGRLSVHGAAAFRRDGTLKFRGSDAVWSNPANGASGENTQSSKVFVRRVVESASLGADYDLSPADSLSAAAGYNFRRSRPWFDEHNESLSAGADTVWHRVSYGPNQQSDDNASLTYTHQGDETTPEKGTLKLDIRHSDTVALIDKSYSDIYLLPAQPDVIGHGLSKSARHLSEASLDWSRPSALGDLGAGLDWQDEVNDLTNYQATILNGVETADAGVTNRYRAATTLGAAYLTDQIRRGAWEWLLGARLESAATRITNVYITQGPDASWTALNPSLHVKYAFTAAASLTFSYRRSLQRPDPRDLNPFTTYLDAQNLQQGNPDLKPQVLSAYEVSLDDDHDSFSRSLGAFYRLSRDTVSDARSVIGDDVLLTTKRNGGAGRSAGLTASVDRSFGEVWHMSADGGVYAVSLHTPDLDAMVEQNAMSAYVNLSLDYRKGRDDVSLDAHTQSGGIWPLGRYGPASSLNLSWKRRITGRLSLTLNARDILDGSKSVSRMNTATYRMTGFNHFVARRVYIGFVEKLG